MSEYADVTVAMKHAIKMDWSTQKWVSEVNLVNAINPNVVEVVRCKYCKHRREDGFCKKYQRNIDGSVTKWFIPDDDWFCADGGK